MGPVITRGPDTTIGIPKPLDPSWYAPAMQQM
jgi:hypothetical protein